MGRMLGGEHEYTADFAAAPPHAPPRAAAPAERAAALARMRDCLPAASGKHGQRGLAAALSVPSAAPPAPPGGVCRRLACYPPLGSFLLTGP